MKDSTQCCIVISNFIPKVKIKQRNETDNLHKYLTEEVIGRRIELGVLRGGHKQLISLIAGELR
jgi:hypothetical protein